MMSSAGASALPWLRMFPPSITFEDVEANAVHTTTVTLTNADARIHGVKILKPTSKKFHLVSRDFVAVKLAPGMSTSFELAFSTDHEESFYDTLVIQSDAGTATMPLAAHAPCGDAVVTGSLDMGVVVGGRAVTTDLTIRNRGPRPANFTVDWDRTWGQVIRIDPASGVVGPARDGQAGIAKVFVTCAPGANLTSVTTPVEVTLDGRLGRPTTFHLTAAVVPHTFEILENVPGGGVAKTLGFGTVLFGETRERTAVVYNNGPAPVEFAASCSAAPLDDVAAAKAAASSVSASTRFDDIVPGVVDLRGCVDASLTFGDAKGTLAPYEKRVLTFSLSPTIATPTKGFKSKDSALVGESREMKYLAIVSFKGHDTRLALPITARAVAGCLAVDPPLLDFGPIASDDVGDHLVTIKNTNKEMPVDFTAPRIKFFKTTPSSGVIPAGQQVSVVVRYEPKNLGAHKERLAINALGVNGEIIQTTTLIVKGVSHEPGEKWRPLPGGTMALPEDFVKQRKYVNPMDVTRATIARSKAGRGTRPPTLERSETMRLYEAVDRNETFGFTLEQATAKERNKSGYVEYLRARRTQRVGAKVDPTDDLSLGLRDKCGLRDNGPPLPDPREPLWLDPNETARPMKHLRPKTISQHVAEAKELDIARKHKEHPTTAREMKECGRVLIPKEVAKLTMGPSTLDFGTVCALSTNTKYFPVTNRTDQCVFVEVDAEAASPWLRGSGPRSQVVPPGETASFALRLRVPEATAGVRVPIVYTVNSNANTRYSFDVVANVVPVTIKLNNESLSFRFAQENWEDVVDETLVLSNQGSYPAEFEWKAPPGCAFTVSPSSGVVPGCASKPVVVTWLPQRIEGGKGGGVNAADLELSVVGNPEPIVVPCSGEAGEPRARFKEKHLDLGTCAVGFTTHRSVSIANLGEVDAVFSVLPLHDGAPVSCEPTRGRIAEASSKEIEITCYFDEPGSHDFPLCVKLRGGKIIKCRVTAEAIVPVVSVKQKRFTFDDVFVGGVRRLPVTVTNHSVIDATFVINLKKFPEFSVQLPSENWSEDVYEEGPPIVRASENPDSPPDTVSGARPMPGAPAKELASTTAAGDGFDYALVVAANASLTFNLVFRPTVENTHAFALPLFLRSVDLVLDENVQRTVRARSEAPRLAISPSTSIFFGPRILLREGFRKIPYAHEMTLTNNDNSKNTMQWSFGACVNENNPAGPKPDAHAKCVRFEPSFGSLAYGASIVVKCYFEPLHALPYDVTVPVYLDNVKDVAYETLEVNGVGCHPKLTFDVKEVVLAPTPLGVATTRRFNLVNDGYGNVEVSCRLPTDTAKIPMEVSFPEGKNIGRAKPILPVDITFKSRKPISFTADVDFLDEDARRFSIPVSGTADNCLLTLEPFMAANADLKLVGDEGRPVLVSEPETVEVPSASAVESGVNERLLMNWLNCTTSIGPFDDIPGNFIESKGRLMTELVEYWSGHPVPGKIGSGKVLVLSAKKREAAEQLLEQNEKLLGFLKAHGALLNSVKPEMLLDPMDFHRVLDRRVAKYYSHANKNPDETEGAALKHWVALDRDRARFVSASAAAYRATLTQIIKIFVLSRVTPKQFKTMPGVDPAVKETPDGTLSGSQVFSVAEGILLKWLSYHSEKIFKSEARRVVNFSSDLKSGSVFYATLVSHWPSLKEHGGGMCRDPKTNGDYLANAECVLGMLKAVNMPYLITASQLVNAKPAERVLFVLFLYNTLPQLIPKTNIEFPCTLHVKTTKQIELTNPTKKNIVYEVRLEGEADFKVDANKVRLGPKATAHLPVALTPRTSTPGEAKLMLSCNREGSAPTATTLVFGLKPKLDAEAPLRRFNFDASCYEHVITTVELENPFPGDCEFAIEVKNFDADEVKAAADAAALEAATSAGAGAGSGWTRERGVAPATTARLTATNRPKVPKVDSSLFPDPFGVNRRSTRVRRGDAVALSVSYLPFTMGSHVAHVTFTDAKYGSFVYELNGTSDYPMPFVTKKETVEITAQQILVPLTYQNGPFEDAKRSFLEKHPLNKFQDQVDKLRCAAPWPKKIEYRLQTHSKYMEVPKDRITLTLNGAKAKSVVEKNNKGDVVVREIPGENDMPIDFTPKGPGRYPGKVVLVSPYDVRVIEVEFNADDKDTAASLEFECAARQVITQDIPMVNNGPRAMTVQSKFEGDVFFTGPRDLIVPGGQTLNYPLSFKPKGAGEFNGRLTLSTGTTDKSAYVLHAVVSDPLAEAHVILHCQARTKTSQRLTIPNVYGVTRGATYVVSSDLGFVSGQSKAHAKCGGVGYFDLEVRPPCSGKHLGTITFTAPNGYYCWFTLEIHATPPPSEDVIAMEVATRQAVTVKIPLSNPTDFPALFKVTHEGHGVLGSEEFRLKPRSEGAYDLAYSPLLMGRSQGFVTFRDARLGEFAFELDLTPLEAKPIKLPKMSAAVGLFDSTTVSIENPLDDEVLLDLSCDNRANFSFSPNKVLLPPFGVGKFDVRYSPSSMGPEERGTITATSQRAGTWTFAAVGVGALPGDMPKRDVYVTCGETGHDQIVFKNPFDRALTVSLTLETRTFAEDDPFAIAGLKRHKNVLLPAFGVLHVPFTFSPKRMMRHDATLVVSDDGSDLAWRFPIVGSPEGAPDGTEYHIEGKARRRLETSMSFRLPGLKLRGRSERYTHAIVAPNDIAREHLERALTLQPIKSAITSETDPLHFAVVFRPVKAIDFCTCELVIEKASGGRWRFPVHVRATEPDIDGVLQVSAYVGEVSETTFTLANPDPLPCNFTAYFNPGGPQELTVSPECGLMRASKARGVSAAARDLGRTTMRSDVVTAGPADPELGGAEFVVSYAPTSYGSDIVGELIVHTPQTQWTFKVIGTVPEYDAPEGRKKVVTKISREVEESLRRAQDEKCVRERTKNIVHRNVRGGYTSKVALGTSKLRKTEGRKTWGLI